MERPHIRFSATIGVVLAIGGISVCSPSLFGQAKGKLTAEQVQSSIDRGVQFLKTRQDKASGKWDGYADYGCGQTSLVILSLLSCGVSPEDPVVLKALNHLRTVQPKKTYECSLQCMAFCLANPTKDWKLIERDVKWLVDSQQQSGPDLGGWYYGMEQGGSDPSNSQFALLGLWEAQRVGVSVPTETLKNAYGYWRSKQGGDGGWSYDRGSIGANSGSMTCAGIASLLIGEDVLNANGDAIVRNDQIQCCNGTQAINAVDLGVQWMTQNYSIQSNPNGSGFWTYYLYAMERVGRLTGLRFFGNHDWYREGCELLLQRQDKVQGFFNSDGQDLVTDTALSLLFLSKGKRQVVLGRLDYRHAGGKEIDWALHRRGIQNLTGQIEKVWKRDLAWQTVTLGNASLADLLECPVLFISGRNRLRLAPNEKELLKGYVKQGGFIFAEACNGDGCDGKGFEESFRELVEELFDEPLRKLSPSHPIWSAEVQVAPEALPNDFWLYGMEQCCRTSIVFSPISLSCRWDILKPYGPPLQIAPSTLSDLQNATKLGINVVSYATGRELKQKLDAVKILEPTPDMSPLLRGTLVMPKLQHAGGADDVPRAIPNLLEVMRREVQNQVSSKPILIDPVDQSLEKYPLVYIHGRQKFAWTSEQRAAIRRFFVERGGFLIGDSICANLDFADSLRNELREILPEASMQRVPLDHPMLTQEFGGFNIQRVTIVDPSNTKNGNPASRKVGSPVLEMLVWNDGTRDRIVAVFSPLDISCALESRGATQCRGYITQDAERIGINLILFAHLQ